MSVIHYKFKSAKDYDTFKFEGAGIPVWDLKNEIIQAKRLGKSNDFDLIISNAQTNEEYLGDSFIIPKNTSVLVKRVPAPKNRLFSKIPNGATPVATEPVKYSAPRVAREGFKVVFSLAQPALNSFAGYLPTRPAGFVGRPMLATSGVGTSAEMQAALGASAELDEDAKIEAMMSASSSAWSQNQQSITSDGGFRRFRPSSSAQHSAGFRGPVVPPPPYYVCFRCGQKGHYIANCPTNSDPAFDKPRVKKSTGIPRSFLKVVNPTNQDPSQSLMVTADGSLVVAVSNDQEWQRVSSTVKSRAAQIPPELITDDVKCRLCSLLLADAVGCPLCAALFCDDCIRVTAAKGGQAKCPVCTKAFLVDQLCPVESARKRVEQLVSSQQAKPGDQQHPQPQQQQGEAKPVASAPFIAPPPLPGFPFPAMIPPLFPFPPPTMIPGMFPPPPPPPTHRVHRASSSTERGGERGKPVESRHDQSTPSLPNGKTSSSRRRRYSRSPSPDTRHKSRRRR